MLEETGVSPYLKALSYITYKNTTTTSTNNNTNNNNNCYVKWVGYCVFQTNN